MSQIDYSSLLRLSGRARDLKIAEAGLALFPRAFEKRSISPDYRGLCLVHVERNPSFYLKVRWNKYKCFGCGIEGGPIGFALDIPRNDSGLAYLERRLGFSRNNPTEVVVILGQGSIEVRESIEEYSERSWVGLDFGPPPEELARIYHELLGFSGSGK